MPNGGSRAAKLLKSSNSKDFVDVSTVERHEQKVAVGRRLDVSNDAEIAPDDAGLAPCGVVEGRVVGYFLSNDRAAIARQLKAHQPSSQRIVVDGEPDEEVPEILRSERLAVEESDRGGRQYVLPAELRVAVVRSREHEQP